MCSQVKKKEFFSNRDISLIQGNTLQRNLFDTEFIDLIVTSPPYNLGIDYNSSDDALAYQKYLEFSEQWMSNCYFWSLPQTRFLLNIPLDKNKGGNKSVGADLTKIAQEIGWKYHSTIVWNEGNISRRTAWGSWLSASAPYVIAPVELIVVLYKEQWKKTRGSIFSYQEDLVFDPFVGSGTSLLVAANLNRKTIGVEIDKNYCELAKKRILAEAENLFYCWREQFPCEKYGK